MNKILVPLLARFLILAIPGFSQGAETITASLTIPKGQPALKTPNDVLVDDAGDIYVLSHLGITKIDSDGNKILSFSSAGVNDGQLNNPISFSFDNAGNFYVSDSGNDRIQVFDPSGSFVRRWGSLCILDSNFDGVYNDPGLNCVDPDGAGPLEIGDGQLNLPTGVCV